MVSPARQVVRLGSVGLVNQSRPVRLVAEQRRTRSGDVLRDLQLVPALGLVELGRRVEPLGPGEELRPRSRLLAPDRDDLRAVEIEVLTEHRRQRGPDHLDVPVDVLRGIDAGDPAERLHDVALVVRRHDRLERLGKDQVQQAFDLNRRGVLRQRLDELAELPGIVEELVAPTRLERLPGAHELEEEAELLPPLRLGEPDPGEPGREGRVKLRRDRDRARHPAEHPAHPPALGLCLRVVLAQVVEEQDLRGELDRLVRGALELLLQSLHERPALGLLVDDEALVEVIEGAGRPDRPPGREERPVLAKALLDEPFTGGVDPIADPVRPRHQMASRSAGIAFMSCTISYRHSP